VVESQAEGSPLGSGEFSTLMDEPLPGVDDPLSGMSPSRSGLGMPLRR
jgi:hypothetical protein